MTPVDIGHLLYMEVLSVDLTQTKCFACGRSFYGIIVVIIISTIHYHHISC